MKSSTKYAAFLFLFLVDIQNIVFLRGILFYVLEKC